MPQTSDSPAPQATSLPLDYATLWQAGIASLQRLAGTTWTDHNAHDPGITILEQLCYVLTDLAYRAQYDLRDLLAGPGGAAAGDSLFSPAEILTTNPVTILDLRKVVLDVEGVKNAWIEPVRTFEPPLHFDPADETLCLAAGAQRKPVELRGVYRVLVAAGGTGAGAGTGVVDEIRRRLNACRRLGEDFEAPQVLPQQQVAITAELELDVAHDPGTVLRVVYGVAADYVAPRVRFYTLAEMLARGQRLDEVLDGPRLEHGFIDAAELAQLERPAGLRASDLLARLMEIDGVRAVHDLRLGGEAWYLALDQSSTPSLDFALSSFKLRRGEVVWTPSTTDVERIAGDLRWAETPPKLPAEDLDLAVATGRDRQVGRYHSVQHHLPQVYGVGWAGLPAGATPERQAQVRQLRAYLMLFDQVLANCFSQTAHARDLFSFAEGEVRTYFSQLPTDVPRADEVLDAHFEAAALQALTETPELATARQQRFLNHLLARFAEEFGDYALLGDATQRTSAQRMAAQRAFLRAYPAVSGGRGKAFDYTRPSWGEANHFNLSGLEQRLAFKLGLPRFYRRALADLPAEDVGGFHLVEHILLRPRPTDVDPGASGDGRSPAFLAKPHPLDPYSAQLTVVFPAWLTAFGGDLREDVKQTVRAYLEKTVREETPAHLSVRVRFLSRGEMAEFEPAYRTWLNSLVIPA